MKSAILFKTKSGNRYFYSTKRNQSILCHPILYHLVKLYINATDLKAWVRSLDKNDLEIEGCGPCTKKQIEYYYNKFLVLFKAGYFENLDRKNRLSGRMTPDLVKSTLANTRQVTFEVTDACNLNCEYCGYGKFYEDYDKRDNKNLDINTAKNLLSYFAQLWNSPLNTSHGKNIYISFYGGEPLLNMSFLKEVVSFSKKLRILHNTFSYSITTNALLLEKNMDFLVENKFNILISLDGDEKNNSYRVFKNGGSAYDQIIKNVFALKKKYPSFFKKNVTFNGVLHNKNSVAEVYKYFKKNFGKTPRVSELNTSGIKESKKKEFWQTYRNLNESLYQAEDYSLIEKDMFVALPTIQSVTTFIHQSSGNVYKNYNYLLYPMESVPKRPTGTCNPFDRRVFVTASGKLMPCERIGQQHVLGHADENNVRIDFDEIADRYNRYYDKMRKQCSLCFNIEACIQCVFNIDTIDSANPVCLGFMNYNDFSKFLSANLSYLEKTPGLYPRIMEKVTID